MSIFRRIIIVVCLLITSVSMVSAQTYIDLKPQFDADTFLETGGAGLGTGLDGKAGESMLVRCPAITWMVRR